MKEIARQKSEDRLKQPMRGLPSAHFISMFVQSFQQVRQQISRSFRSPDELAAALEREVGVARTKLLVERAFALMKASQFEEAMVMWKQAAALASSEHLQEWIESATKGEILHPGMAITMCGMFAHLQGGHDDALALYNQALDVRPGLVETLCMRASLYYEKQKVEGALELWGWGLGGGWVMANRRWSTRAVGPGGWAEAG